MEFKARIKKEKEINQKIKNFFDWIKGAERIELKKNAKQIKIL